MRQRERGDAEGDPMRAEPLLGVGGQCVLPVSVCPSTSLSWVIPGNGSLRVPFSC